MYNIRINMPKNNLHIVSSHAFLLLAHYATFAFQDILFEYLTSNKAVLVTKFNLPLPELPLLKKIEITDSKKGKIETTRKITSVTQPPIFAYAIQSLQLFFTVLLSINKYDIIIAQDRLLAFIAIILRTIGKCKIVIFYSHGVDRTRFKYAFINKLYNLLDLVSATNSNFNWFLNKEMINLRKQQGVDPNTSFWVPSSISTDTVLRLQNVFNHKIVFLGVLNNKNGANLLPKIILLVKKAIPDIILDIIGDGQLKNSLESETVKLGLNRNINFLGVLKFTDFSQILTNYSVGIAPYEDVFDTLTSTSDSMKMRVYLAAGLPVVITKGFVFSREIEENNLGLTVQFKTKSFAKAVVKLLQNPTLNKKIRRKALVYSKKYDITNIYDRVLAKILKKEL